MVLVARFVGLHGILNDEPRNAFLRYRFICCPAETLDTIDRGFSMSASHIVNCKYLHSAQFPLAA